ncbi:MAG: TIM barrel protein [Candidatus Woesearchaeota archaeon]
MAGSYFKDLDKYLAPQEENRFLDGPTKGSDGGPKLSDPIVPISRLGTTFGEKDPRSGQENVVQQMLSSIRQGTGQLQLAMQTSPDEPNASGGIAGIGKTKRQAIKEVIKASEIDWQGLELPPSAMSNLSGFDGRQNTFSEEKRKRDLQNVRDAIQFSAEIEAGGGIDVWSQEFPRSISTAKFNRDPKWKFESFEGFDENEDEVRYLVNTKTGRLEPVRADSIGGQEGASSITVPVWKTDDSGNFIDETGNPIKADPDDPDYLMRRVPEWDDKNKKIKTETMDWSKFKKEYVKELNRREYGDDKSQWKTPEEWWYRLNKVENGYSRQRAQALQFTQGYEQERNQYMKLLEEKKAAERMEEGKSEDELRQLGLLEPTGTNSEAGRYLSPDYKPRSQVLQEQLDNLKQRMEFSRGIATDAETNAMNAWEMQDNVKPVEEYALDKTTDSYAELGVYAMQETMRNKGKLKRPIQVGPELGFPEAYGGHPDEFIEMIKKSRKKMEEKLKKDPKIFAKHGPEGVKKLANKHIAGMMDTSHLSMWYNHFPKKDKNESESKRLKRFNKWFKESMKKLGKEGVVGSVQVVDSAAGPHRHLPPGEGVFPSVEGVKLMQKEGFDGPIVSEGHGEEMQEPGKIQYSLWNEFGASIGTGYAFGTGGGNAFGNIYGGIGGAAGYRAPANYIVGGYSPSNEWSLWSEVPLE